MRGCESALTAQYTAVYTRAAEVERKWGVNKRGQMQAVPALMVADRAYCATGEEWNGTGVNSNANEHCLVHGSLPMHANLHGGSTHMFSRRAAPERDDDTNGDDGVAAAVTWDRPVKAYALRHATCTAVR